MSSTFKYPFVFIIYSCFWQINAQNSLKIATEKSPDRPVAAATAGVYWANPAGASFVKNGMDLKPGFALGLHAYLLPHFTLGMRYTFVNATVSDTRVTGNYDSSNIWVIGGTLGYDFSLVTKLNLLMLGGVGSAVYRNQKANLKFTDRGLALWLTPEISYRFTRNIALYIAPEYRYDHMNIDVPNALENSFNKVSYFSLGAGLRFRL